VSAAQRRLRIIEEPFQSLPSMMSWHSKTLLDFRAFRILEFWTRDIELQQQQQQ
jgi:hypothetical protein